MADYGKWLVRGARNKRSTSQSETWEMMAAGYHTPTKEGLPAPSPLGPKRISLAEVQTNQARHRGFFGASPKPTTSSSRDPLLSNSRVRPLKSSVFKGKILHTPSQIQKNSRVRKTTIDAKNAISTLDKMKAGTAPSVDKLQRFMVDAQKSAVNVFKKVRVPTGRSMRVGGMMGLGLAGVMGLSLALSKTRHGRES
jgi:hypothetical protein